MTAEIGATVDSCLAHWQMFSIRFADSCYAVIAIKAVMLNRRMWGNRYDSEGLIQSVPPDVPMGTEGCRFLLRCNSNQSCNI